MQSLQSRNRGRKRSKTLLIVVLALLLVAAVVAGVAYNSVTNSTLQNEPTELNREINYETPTEEEMASGNEAKKRTIKESEQKRSSSKVPFSTTITAASVEDGVLYVRNQISGIYSEGNCSLVLTKDNQTVTKQSDVQPLPQSTTCKGFNIPVAELSQGTWKISLTVTINSESAHAEGSIKV